jgi:hypothetical protein
MFIGAGTCGTPGSVKQTVVPFLSPSGPIHILPPWAPVMLLTMARLILVLRNIQA